MSIFVMIGRLFRESVGRGTYMSVCIKIGRLLSGGGTRISDFLIIRQLLRADGGGGAYISVLF